ncbi:uncharacterized protein LOC141641228 [Silene latifolia]|uniref:uncharacterized protein LOC141641228 n=1 Tax=Silene latifolia TaxID=37657 RepID=UPI003D7805BD
MFVLPKGIISRIEATCRNFLWDNSSDYRRVPLVAWEKVSCTKEEGGLGIKDQETMNKAMIGRLVHWIMEERDSIWVKWVHQNYLKGKAWLDYKHSVNFSWVWRRICKVKEEMLPGYNDGTWNAQAKYTPAMGYEWLKDRRPAVTWSKWIWNEHVVPKHQFVWWLYAHGAMRTKDKLIKYGLENDDSCFLCNQAAESLDHLWCDCIYSKKVVQEMSQRMKIVFPVTDVLGWCTQMTGTAMQKGVQLALLWGMVYQIWQQRNKSRMEGILMRPERTVSQIIEEIKARIRGRDFRMITKTDLDWLQSKELYVLDT